MKSNKYLTIGLLTGFIVGGCIGVLAWAFLQNLFAISICAGIGMLIGIVINNMEEKTMTYEEICKKISSSCYSIANQKDVANGKQLRLNNGAIINCFNNGNHNVQGQNVEEVKCFLAETGVATSRKVFVVYGHDDTSKTQLEALLRRWDLEPIILDQQASGGQTIIEKLEAYSSDVAYAIVLATPDDEGKSKTENDYKSRVRQNVVLELGMFLAKLGREKVAILLKEANNFEKPSDIQGLIYIPFQNRVEEVSINLVRELTRQGYTIDAGKL